MTRPPSSMTRSTSGPPNGSRRDAKQSAAAWRASLSCSRRATTITRSKSLSAPTNANASGLETRASIPRYRADSTPSRLRERVTHRKSLQAFKESLPVLLSVSGGGDDDSGTTAAAREGRVRFVIEGYLRLLSRNPTIVPASAIEETFGYADVLRGQSVQRALQASSARSATKDPVLAELVRASQDIDKKIGAAVGALNNLLTAAGIGARRKGGREHRGRDRAPAGDAHAEPEGHRQEVSQLRRPGKSSAPKSRRSAEAAHR